MLLVASWQGPPALPGQPLVARDTATQATDAQKSVGLSAVGFRYQNYRKAALDEWAVTGVNPTDLTTRGWRTYKAPRRTFGLLPGLRRPGLH
jgi:hypothetical protein